MKKTLLTVMVSLLVPTAMAAFAPTYMPDSTHYDGFSHFSEVSSSGTVLSGKVEYAVYDTTMQASDLGLSQDYEGPRFIYAYQVFNFGAAALNYFEVQGVNPDTIASVNNDISAEESLGASDSYGVAPTNYFFSDTVTEGIWFFDGMTIAQAENSWFLLIYSDYDYTQGSYTVLAPEDSDIVVPDDGLGQDTGNIETPEPATLVMLMGGALLSLRRRK